VVAHVFDSDFKGNQRGYYQHWGWHHEGDGNRAAHALPSTHRHMAELISTAYHNKFAPDAVYALVLDVDADRTQPCFLDSDGRVDPRLVMDALGRQLPLTRYHLTIVCRSTSGKGLHLFFSMVPVVLTEEVDSPAEVFALRVQRALIEAANEMGIGADPSAVGLRRLVANFNNSDRVIFRDQKKRTKIENAAKNVARSLEIVDEITEVAEPHHALRVMGKELEAFLRERRRQKRLYPENKNVELQYARLLCFIVGWLPEAVSEGLGQLGFCQGYFKSTEFSSVRLTMAELQLIFGGTTAPTIRRLLPSRPELFVSHEKGSQIWEIRANPSYWHLFEKAAELVKSGGIEGQRIWNSPWELPEPELVENGFRNQYVVWLMNSYKSRGYSELETLKKIKLRVDYCPGVERSRTMKRLERKVRNFFRNSPQLQGRYADRPLPKWITDDTFFSEKRGKEVFAGKEKDKKEKKPCSEPHPLAPGSALAMVMVGTARVFGDSELDPHFTSLVLTGSRKLEFSQPESIQKDIVMARNNALEALFGNDQVIENSGPSQSENLHKLPEIKLWVVRRNQRIGIIRNNNLLLCFTKKHYRASALIEYLLNLNPNLKNYHLRLISPKKNIQALFYDQIDQSQEVFSGASICGRKMTYAESMEYWREKKGIKRESRQDVPLDYQIPF
jgi:hypothetical protein